MASLLLSLIIIAAGFGVSDYLEKTAPKAQKRIPEKTITRVATQILNPDSQQVTVSAMGSVIPAREMTLKARVSGQIESIHPEFTAGGYIRRGEDILKIDPQDYQLALARKESQLIDAQYELKIEMGHQEVAQREWTLLNTGKPANPNDVELALRKPHLAKAKADYAAAQAELEQAKLSLSRTDIKAPFNAVVRDKFVETGSQVTTQDALADLVGTDAYWIRVSLPVERLQWIQIPVNRSQTGSPVTVHYRGFQRPGRVIRLLGDLEPQGRMARILVSVDDPLGLRDPRADRPPLLIGEYVRVEIRGDRLADVYRIPRSALRDQNTIWLVGKDDTLQIRTVDIVWRDEKSVLIKDQVHPGDRLVVSDLGTPVPGMPLAPETKASSDDTAASKIKVDRNG